MAKKNSITIEIKGAHYEFILQSPQTYKRNHGSDSSAITYIKEKKVYFKTDDFTPNVVRHELIHVFVAESHTSSANLTEEQLEELFCEIIAESYFLIGQICDRIITALN